MPEFQISKRTTFNYVARRPEDWKEKEIGFSEVTN